MLLTAGQAGDNPMLARLIAEHRRQRNTVERSFNRFKHWRGIATRYDKYALTYLGGLTLAAIVIHHRTHLPDRA